MSGRREDGRKILGAGRVKPTLEPGIDSGLFSRDQPEETLAFSVWIGIKSFFGRHEGSGFRFGNTLGQALSRDGCSGVGLGRRGSNRLFQLVGDRLLLSGLEFDRALKVDLAPVLSERC